MNFYNPSPTKPYWSQCSATVITAANKSTVITAGHCVYNPDPDNNGVVTGNGYSMTNMTFCPGYEYKCTLGKWTVTKTYTTSKWFYGAGAGHAYDWSDDVAMLVIKPLNGYKIQDWGSARWESRSTRAADNLTRTAFGYPAADSRWPEYKYDGEDLMYCQGTDTYFSAAGVLRIPCTMTGGASGGPWLSWVNANWLGYVNSVNSHKAWGGPTMGGPYFGTAEQALYNYVKAIAS